MIETEAVEELQKILAEEYKKKLSIEDVGSLGEQLVNLFETMLIQDQRQVNEPKTT